MYRTAMSSAASQDATATRNRYLVDVSDPSDLARIRRQSEIGNTEAREANVEVAWFRFWRRPGQTQQQLDGLAEEFRRASSAAQKAAGVGQRSLSDDTSESIVSVVRNRQSLVPGV
jgi:hypothetical protein